MNKKLAEADRFYNLCHGCGKQTNDLTTFVPFGKPDEETFRETSLSLCYPCFKAAVNDELRSVN
jgi:hypothetical protein